MSLTPYEPPPAAASSLEVWAYTASKVHQVAEVLARTSFVPPHMQGRPDEIAAQILYGQEVRLSPMVALNQIYIIERRPCMSALAMRGLAQASGVKFRLDESTETRCRMSAMAPTDQGWTTVTWTMDRAKKLGLATKANWLKQPQSMLIARSTAELCRLVAAPLFLGMAYSVEELKDSGDDLAYLTDAANAPEQPVEPPPVEPEQRTLRRQPIVDKPAPDRPPVGYSTEGDSRAEPTGEAANPDMVTQNTRKALMAQFNGAGIAARDTRLAYVSDLLKREINSVNQVTEAEARDVLTQLRIDYPQTITHDGEWPAPAEVPA